MVAIPCHHLKERERKVKLKVHFHHFNKWQRRDYLKQISRFTWHKNCKNLAFFFFLSLSLFAFSFRLFRTWILFPTFFLFFFLFSSLYFLFACFFRLLTCEGSTVDCEVHKETGSKEQEQEEERERKK